MPDQRSVMKEFRSLDAKRLSRGLSPEEEARFERLRDLVGPEMGAGGIGGGFDVNAAAARLRESLLPAGLRNQPPPAPLHAPEPELDLSGAELAPEESAEASAVASAYAAEPFAPLESAGQDDPLFDPATLGLDGPAMLETPDASLGAVEASAQAYGYGATYVPTARGDDPGAAPSDPNAAGWDPNAAAYDPNLLTYDPNAPTYDPGAVASDANAAAYADPHALAYDPNAAAYDPNALTYDPSGAGYDPNALAYEPPAPISDAQAWESSGAFEPTLAVDLGTPAVDASYDSNVQEPEALVAGSSSGAWDAAPAIDLDGDPALAAASQDDGTGPLDLTAEPLEAAPPDAEPWGAAWEAGAAAAVSAGGEPPADAFAFEPGSEAPAAIEGAGAEPTGLWDPAGFLAEPAPEVALPETTAGWELGALEAGKDLAADPGDLDFGAEVGAEPAAELATQPAAGAAVETEPSLEATEMFALGEPSAEPAAAEEELARDDSLLPPGGWDVTVEPAEPTAAFALGEYDETAAAPPLLDLDAETTFETPLETPLEAPFDGAVETSAAPAVPVIGEYDDTAGFAAAAVPLEPATEAAFAPRPAEPAPCDVAEWQADAAIELGFQQESGGSFDAAPETAPASDLDALLPTDAQAAAVFADGSLGGFTATPFPMGAVEVLDEIPTIDGAEILEEIAEVEDAPAAPSAIPVLASAPRTPRAAVAAPLPEPPLPPPDHLAGAHRVVVHTVDGQVKRGVLEDADLAAAALRVAPAAGGAEETVATDKVKAIFFMLSPGDVAPAPSGKKVRVTFRDGRQVAGYGPDYRDDGVGFFMIPADTRTNTGRIWVYRAAVKQVAVS